MINIQSNVLRGEYARDIVTKTINEIHDDIQTVFGPFAVEAYLTKDGQPYYTKDGLEVLQQVRFDNDLSMYVMKILYQAVHNQGKKIGDGTTTLAMLYTNIYREIFTCIEESKSDNPNYELSVLRPIWNKMIKEFNEEIKRKAVQLTDEHLASALYTCTQDTELAGKIYTELHDAIMDESYITINKSNIATDFNVTIHNHALFKVTKQFSVKPVAQSEPRCVVFHCNGMLDIAHTETFLGLMSRTMVNAEEKTIPITYILLCNGITSTTRETTKKLIHDLHSYDDYDKLVANFNNVTIYTLNEYRGFSNDELEDISTIITDENGIGGLVNSLTFESLIYQSLCMDNNTLPPIDDLKTFDCDLSHIEKIKEMSTNYYQIDFDEVEGMRLYKPFGEYAQKRYDDLRKAIEDEKSEVKKVVLHKRLRKMYGQFIEVEVGSKLIKDSQRKYELILDAVVSSMEGVRHGVLCENSILVAAKVIVDSLNAYDYSTDTNRDPYTAESKNPYVMFTYNVLLGAFYHTFKDMLLNSGCIDPDFLTPAEFLILLTTKNLNNFNLSNIDTTRKITDINQIIPDTVVDDIETYTSDDKSVTITKHITEPVTIITNILENSTIPIELALAKTFQLNSFLQNYI